MPLICHLLAQRDAIGDCSVKFLEAALGLAPRSGYPYLSHRVLDAQQLRQLFHALAGRPEAQEAILAYIAEGTGWIYQHVAADKDVNGDGLVNTSDVLDAIIKSLELDTQGLHEARAAERTGFKSPSRETIESLLVKFRASMRHLHAGIQVLSFLAERTRPVSVSLSSSDH